jgi:hypothetical protein
MLQWHCPLNNVVCGTAIDCCSNFLNKLFNTERSVTSNTVTMEETIVGQNSGLCLHTASRKQLSPTVQVSDYTQLHVTYCLPQSRSLSTQTSCNQLSPTFQVSVYTQLHVTNSHPQFRSLPTHSFI